MFVAGLVEAMGGEFMDEHEVRLSGDVRRRPR